MIRSPSVTATDICSGSSTPCFSPRSSTRPAIRSRASTGLSLEAEREGEVEEELRVGRAFDLGRSSGSTARSRSRRIRGNSRMRPLCMKSQRPCRNGCVFVSCTAVPVEAGCGRRRGARRCGPRARAGCGRSRPGGRSGRRRAPSEPVVPADPEAVPVRRGRAHSRVEALVDERVLPSEDECLDRDRVTVVRKPAAHRSLPSVGNSSGGSLGPRRRLRCRVDVASLQMLSPVRQEVVDCSGADDRLARRWKCRRMEHERSRLRPPSPPWKQMSSSKAHPSSRVGS